MATDDAVRHSLHRQLEDDYGPAEAALLMTGVPPFPWTEVATKRDLDLLGREIRSETRESRGEFRGELREVRGELLEKIGALDAKIVSQKWTLLAGYLVGTATIAGAFIQFG